eukprot:SM000015S01166  [mRNA]  locus=s15:129993:131134:- [translate_table: standard]
MAPSRSTLASPGSSALYSALLFVVLASAQQVGAPALASTETLTIAGGFVSALLFVLALTCIGNVQETMGGRAGWGSVLVALVIATGLAATVHRVCATTCILFSLPLLYEVHKISAVAHAQPAETEKKL